MLKIIIIRFMVVPIFLCGSLLFAFAQTPDSLWVKMYGGADYDRARSIIQTADGGFAVIGEFGYYFEAGIQTNGDIWLVRTDADGDTLWTRAYGGPGIDEGYSIQQTSDGGYIIAGARSNNFGFFNAWLIRTDESGETLWAKTYDPSTLGWASFVQETTDGGFIFTGLNQTQTTFSNDLWLVRTDAEGDTLWTKTYGGTGVDLGNSVRQTPDGGFIVTGSTREIGTNPDLWLLRTDDNGDTLWTKRYNGNPTFNDVDQGRDIQLISDDGFFILGQSGVSIWLLSTDMNGDTLRTTQFYGTGTSFNQTADGGYIIAGGMSIIRTDDTGVPMWTRDTDGFCNSVLQLFDGGYLVAGGSPIFGATDLWLFRLGPDGTTAIRNEGHTGPDRYELSQNYPNPFNPTTTISYSVDRQDHVELTIFNMLGQPVRKIVSESIPAGTYTVTWDGRNDAGQLLSSGSYFYRLKAGNYTHTRRMVFLK
jgi:hypothetical protein